ncbi:CDP-glycerol glycerophosphotransferase [Asanoa hainanensis]|uniref:CDP-glycerol glycerophosphotransferase n=1 Tax=Asanoa hainanensis TaxID=560556 RepID=A0A239NSJ4_9ACTN|nr:glycosyltransferase [Asanoa hainanensis]SNT57825.1 CDP-glycerol glycerophosphotransferase [Asanoa hainanensis]
MLSVVVPVHNVARYLDICLESLAAQTYRDLEVVLVDDGSTDGSGSLADAWPARDPRFRVVHQANAGLGAARNAGAALATGDYLAFVDADDVLPPYAFEVLVNALEQTGSDFASGNVSLLTDGALTPSPLHRGTHRETRLAVNPRSHRYLVYDRLACNKVWRRSFWGSTRFPEGVHYEDIPVTVPLYGRASSVDVIDLPVYYWRQRPAGDPSISQRLAEQRNLDDRFAAVSSALSALSALDGPFATWYAETALQSDLRLVLEVLPDVDDAYRARFAKLATAFLAGVDADSLSRLPQRLAAAWKLTRDGDLDGLVRLVSSVRASAAPGAGMAAWRDPVTPAVRATAVDWVGGWLRISLADSLVPLALLWLREGSPGDQVVALPSAGGSGLLRPSRLRGRQGWRPAEWTVNVAPARDALRAPVRVTEPLPFQARWVDQSTLVTPLARSGVLRVVVERPAVVAAEAGEDAGDLYVDGCGELAPGTLLRLERAAGVPSLAYPVVASGPKWMGRVPLADLVAAIATPGVPDEPPAVWRVALGEPGGPSVPLPAGPRLTPATAGPVRIDIDPRGILRVTAAR